MLFAYNTIVLFYKIKTVIIYSDGIDLTLFHAGWGGIYAPPTKFRQFSPDVLVQEGSNYTLNSSFVITEHIKLVPGQKIFLRHQSWVGS